MLLYPEVQKRAQKCIDDACKGRLPDYDDYDDMPYMHALVQETLRWKPASPISTCLELLVVYCASTIHVSRPDIPHRLTKDDVYRGYFIPEGSMVFANNWYVTYHSSLRDVNSVHHLLKGDFARSLHVPLSGGIPP